MKTLQPIDSEAETTQTSEFGIQKREQTHEDLFSPKKLVSLRSVSSLRRPLGPRQPSPRSVTGTLSSTSGTVGHRAGTREKEQRYPVASLQDGTKCSGALPASAAVRNASPVHAALFPPTPSTPQASTTTHRETSAAKQLSGKPARSRSHARVLADLTGFARNMDLSAHGVGTGKNRPGKVKGARAKGGAGENAGVAASYTKGRGVGAVKNDEDKENVGTRAVSGAGVHGRMRAFGDKENARVPFGTPDIHSQSQTQSRSMSLFQPQAKSTPKDHDASTESALDPLAVLANLSTATNTTKGSVRDRMMDWERERARLREMNQASTVLSGSRSSSSSASTSASGTTEAASDSDSEVEAEVIAQASSAMAEPKPVPAELETIVKTVPMHTIALARTRSGQTTHTTTTAVSSASGLAASTLTGGSGSGEKGEIEVAKLGVRAPAQILTSRNGSLSAVALSQTLGQAKEARRSEEGLKAVGGGSIALVKGVR